MTDPVVADRAPVEVVVVVAHAQLRPVVDPYRGTVGGDPRDRGLSSHDEAALETAARFAAAWSVPSTAITVGPSDADAVLRVAASRGIERLIRVDRPDHVGGPAEVADALVAAVRSRCGSLPVVVAGVHGTDGASGATPAFIAQMLGSSQALGLLEVTPGEPGVVTALRRGDRGIRERIRATAPTVVSVEAGAATLARAPLKAVLAADHASIDVVAAPVPEGVTAHTGSAVPFRPRPRVVSAPVGDDAYARILELTAAVQERTPPRTVHPGPDEAARLILDQLHEWGVGPDRP